MRFALPGTARLAHWLGIGPSPISRVEKLLAALGGLCAILAIAALSHGLLGNDAAMPVIASMGASAVLLFAVPHGTLSQPWPVLAGHLSAALIGVTCARLFGPSFWSGALAVGLAIALMHALRCLHPPGGATALTAVIGGDSINALGYDFVLAPVAINALAILAIAVLFNAPFRWRRYPAALAEATEAPAPAVTTPIDHERLLAALRDIDSYVDVSEHDLLRIYAFAARQAATPARPTPPIRIGCYYSNGRFGGDWEVREVVGRDAPTDATPARVRFRRATGLRRRAIDQCDLATFEHWTAYEVTRDENSWRPVGS